MYAVVNFEKFFDDHPEISHLRAKAMTKVKEAAEGGAGVCGSLPNQVFDAVWARRFHQEVSSTPAHMKLGMEALRKDHTG